MIVQFVSEDGSDPTEYVYELLPDDSALEGVEYVISDQIQIDPKDGQVISYVEVDESTLQQDVLESSEMEGNSIGAAAQPVIVKKEMDMEAEPPSPSGEFPRLIKKEQASDANEEGDEEEEEDVKPAIECQHCFVLFFDHRSFRRHIEQFHSEEGFFVEPVKPKWFCKTCKKYIPLVNKARHKSNCPPGKKFHCKICDTNFVNTTKLESHLAKVHGEGPTMCKVCGLRLSSRYAHMIHMRQHTGERPFRCEICNKSYTNKTSLNGHNMRQHPTEAPFQCPMCERKYRERSSLTAHIQKKHMNIKRHFCSQCGKGFYDRKVMISHFAQVHTDARPFPCSLCDMSYKLKEHLTRHMKNTHLGR